MVSGLLVAQAEPWIRRIRLGAKCERGMLPVADEKQVSKHVNTSPLLTFPEQSRNGDFNVLSEQIEERRFKRCCGMHCGALIVGL